MLVGGTEKLRGDEADYGVPLEPSLEQAIERHAPDLVLDLSDEPVLGPRERFALASRVLALGLPYEGPDFRFDPPTFAPVELPTLAVVGTGKRVGKTAVTGYLARRLAASRRVVVVAMGRGGPPAPETVLVAPTVEGLLQLSRDGRHAASDHLETALVAGVPTVGCRRCGGGLAGAVAVSNVARGDGRRRVARPAARDRRRQRRGTSTGRGAPAGARHVGGAARRGGGRVPEHVPGAHLGSRARDHGRGRRAPRASSPRRCESTSGRGRPSSEPSSGRARSSRSTASASRSSGLRRRASTSGSRGISQTSTAPDRPMSRAASPTGRACGRSSRRSTRTSSSSS